MAALPPARAGRLVRGAGRPRSRPGPGSRRTFRDRPAVAARIPRRQRHRRGLDDRRRGRHRSRGAGQQPRLHADGCGGSRHGAHERDRRARAHARRPGRHRTRVAFARHSRLLRARRIERPAIRQPARGPPGAFPLPQHDALGVVRGRPRRRIRAGRPLAVGRGLARPAGAADLHGARRHARDADAGREGARTGARRHDDAPGAAHHEDGRGARSRAHEHARGALASGEPRDRGGGGRRARRRPHAAPDARGVGSRRLPAGAGRRGRAECLRGLRGCLAPLVLPLRHEPPAVVLLRRRHGRGPPARPRPLLAGGRRLEAGRDRDDARLAGQPGARHRAAERVLPHVPAHRLRASDTGPGLTGTRRRVERLRAGRRERRPPERAPRAAPRRDARQHPALGRGRQSGVPRSAAGCPVPRPQRDHPLARPAAAGGPRVGRERRRPHAHRSRVR